MTTRLSKEDKQECLAKLQGLLNNVCQFVECPLNNRQEVLAMWNSKFPKDMIDAFHVLLKYNLAPAGASTDTITFVTNIGGKDICAHVSMDVCGPRDNSFGTIQYAIGITETLRDDSSFSTLINFKDSSDAAYAFSMSFDHMSNFLGDSKAREVLEWMKVCADMREELKLASKTLSDIFEMVVTAGQIKRMVPDLLQYLPQKQREAFESQKRASSLPFEWAPYPKQNLQNMLLQISKGHLLSGMAKPRSGGIKVGTLDRYTWARYCA